MFPSTRRVARLARLLPALFCLSLVSFGCSTLSAPSAAPVGDQAPVNLRDLQITTTDGHRAVLLQLTRLPTLIRYSASSDPGRIVIQAWGPEGDADLPERILPQSDAMVTNVVVSRKGGELRVVIELNTREAPPHRVHEMADWIMVNFVEAES